MNVNVPAAPSYRLCLSSSMACSGVDMCPVCLKAYDQNVVAVAMGRMLTLEQAALFFRYYEQARTEFQEMLSSDPEIESIVLDLSRVTIGPDPNDPVAQEEGESEQGGLADPRVIMAMAEMLKSTGTQSPPSREAVTQTPPPPPPDAEVDADLAQALYGDDASELQGEAVEDEAVETVVTDLPALPVRSDESKRRLRAMTRPMDAEERASQGGAQPPSAHRAAKAAPPKKSPMTAAEVATLIARGPSAEEEPEENEDSAAQAAPNQEEEIGDVEDDVVSARDSASADLNGAG